MMYKQIIDGIDVAGCEYLGLYKECKLKCGSCCPVDCSDNPNCHYKLYKRKKQECEELRIDIKDIANLLDLDTVEEYSFSNIELEIKELKQQLDQLKAENENLKRQHQGDKGLITSTGKMNYQLLQEYDKLKNCLTEIKEIVEKRNYLDYNECLDDILQKINECEVRNERN